MRVLVAPDCFSGTLTAQQAADAIATGWLEHAPDDDVRQCPLSDGGPGFLDVLGGALDGRLLAHTVPGPLGEPTPAGVLLVHAAGAADAAGAAGPADAAGAAVGVVTAYLETAQACGLHLVPVDRRDPGVTSTYGVGVLMAAARAAGAHRIVLGLGGSGTNDAGAGMLAALRDASSSHRLDPGRWRAGGAGLLGVRPDEVTWLAELREAWAGVDLVVASDVDSPLLGFHGASAGFAAQKGAGPQRAQELERCLGDFAAAVEAAGVAPAKLAARPGAGAAGGLGFGLLLLGARRMPGVQAVIDAVDLPARLRGCDVVVTGEGCFDWQSLRGKVVTGVARTAMDTGTPVVVLAGQVLVGRREAQSIGVESAYPVARTPQEVAAALADPAGTLAARAQRVARTWSPRPSGELG